MLMSGKLMTFSDGHGEIASTLSRLNANGRYNDFYILYQFTHECQSLRMNAKAQISQIMSLPRNFIRKLDYEFKHIYIVIYFVDVDGYTS